MLPGLLENPFCYVHILHDAKLYASIREHLQLYTERSTVKLNFSCGRQMTMQIEMSYYNYCIECGYAQFVLHKISSFRNLQV